MIKHCNVNMMGCSKFKSQCIEIICTMYTQFSMHIVGTYYMMICYFSGSNPCRFVSFSIEWNFSIWNRVNNRTMNAECRPRMRWCIHDIWFSGWFFSFHSNIFFFVSLFCWFLCARTLFRLSLWTFRCIGQNAEL